MDPLKIIFAGTPEFAALSLAALLDNNMLPICVLTQPDRPAGRGKKLTASAVKRLAIRHQLSVLQPEKLTSKFIEDQILPLAPDLIIVVAYGLILPRPLLTLPRFGCINVHASLLPRWRGAAPIQRAILAGDTQSGVTIMQMDEGLDTGDVLLSHPLSIRENETGGSLHDRLAKLGANALLEALKKLQAGALTATPQAKEGASYATKIDKAEAFINWHQPATSIHNQIRAFYPWPIARTEYEDEVIQILASEKLDRQSRYSPGTIETGNGEGMEVACFDEAIRITKVKLAGGRPIQAAEFFRQRQPQGKQLGKANS